MQRVKKRSCSPTAACCFPCNRDSNWQKVGWVCSIWSSRKWTHRGKNSSKDCPAPYQNWTLPTEWAQGAHSCQSHHVQTWGKGEGGDSQLQKRKETPFWHQFTGRVKPSSHALSEQVASNTWGRRQRCGILGLLSRHRQVCRATHNQCRQRCAHKNHSTGLTICRIPPHSCAEARSDRGAHLASPSTAVSLD